VGYNKFAWLFKVWLIRCDSSGYSKCNRAFSNENILDMYASQSICQITLILFALVAGIYLSIGLLFIQFILHMFIISCFDTHYDSNGILFNTFQNRQKSNAKKTHTKKHFSLLNMHLIFFKAITIWNSESFLKPLTTS